MPISIIFEKKYALTSSVLNFWYFFFCQDLQSIMKNLNMPGFYALRIKTENTNYKHSNWMRWQFYMIMGVSFADKN